MVVNKMSQIISSIYLIIATAVKAAGAVVILKLCAFSMGVAEFGKLSQLMGVISLVGMLAASSIGPGLTRTISAVSRAEQRKWIIASVSFGSCVCVGLGIILGLLAWPISNWLWGNQSFVPVLIALGAFQTAVGIAAVAQAVAVARNEHFFVLKFSVLGSFFGVLAVGIGLWLGGMYGAAWGLIVNAAMPGFLAFLLCYKSVVNLGKIINLTHLKDKFRIELLLRYAAVPLAGALSLGLSQLLMREWIAERVGWEAVGYWQAVSRMADMYLQFVSVVLLGVALPRWTQAKGYTATVNPIIKLGSTVLACAAVIALGLYYFSDTVLTLLYSVDFLPAASLMPWQLGGDLLRVFAVCMSTGLIARGETGWPTIFEAAQGLLTLIGTGLLIPLFAGKAPVIAYAVTYALMASSLFILWTWRCVKESDS